MDQAEKRRPVQTALTEFGRVVWVLAAKRDIRTQRDLARAMRINYHTLHNYLLGRSGVPYSMLQSLDGALELTEEEKKEVAWVYAWGETVKAKNGEVA